MLDLSKVQSQKFSAGHEVSAVLRIFTVPSSSCLAQMRRTRSWCCVVSLIVRCK